MMITKIGLIDAIADQTGTPKAGVVRILDAAMATIATTDKVTLPGFGTFALKDRAERQARNPRTGEAVTVAARQVLTFRASKPGRK